MAFQTSLSGGDDAVQVPTSGAYVGDWRVYALAGNDTVIGYTGNCKGRMKFPQIGRAKNPQMVGVVKCCCLGWPPCLLVGAHGVVPPVVLMC